MIWFGWVLWHINHCRLFNAKSSLYIYILNTYDLVGFYGLSTIVGYLMPNPLYNIYIKYIQFDLVGFYGMLTIVSYLILFTNPSARAGYDTRLIFFKAEFNRFEFRVVLLLD